MKYAFIAEHRPMFSIRAMCRSLCVQPSGFCAWLNDPLSRRAREDCRQTELIRAAWSKSGKAYEPPRVLRKLFCLRQAGMACSSSLAK